MTERRSQIQASVNESQEPVARSYDPHAHWIPSADGLSRRNPAPDAAQAGIPNAVTVALTAATQARPASGEAWQPSTERDAALAEIRQLRENYSSMRRTVAAIGVVADVNGFNVIRRLSVLDIIDRLAPKDRDDREQFCARLADLGCSPAAPTSTPSENNHG